MVQTIKVPTGFIEVSVAIRSSSNFPSTSPITIFLEASEKTTSFGMAPNQKIQFPVLPGKVTIWATYGMVASTKYQFDVTAGETKSVTFEFGQP